MRFLCQNSSKYGLLILFTLSSSDGTTSLFFWSLFLRGFGTFWMLSHATFPIRVGTFMKDPCPLRMMHHRSFLELHLHSKLMARDYWLNYLLVFDKIGRMQLLSKIIWICYLPWILQGITNQTVQVWNNILSTKKVQVWTYHYGAFTNWRYAWVIKVIPPTVVLIFGICCI